MPSSYTQTGIELIATGEQSGTWGTTTNVNLQIIDRLTNGVGAIALSGTTHTLTTTDGVLSDGQYAVLVFGGSPSGTNTVTISPNDADHVYIVKNNSGQSVVLTQGSGGNVTIANGKSAIVYSDGAGAGAAVVDITNTFNFQPLTATLTAIGALAVTDGNIIVGNGSTWVAESGATARTSLGLGTIATQAANNVSITGGSITGITDLAVADGGTGASDAATARTNLGLAIGTNVQAYDAGLQSISGLTTSANQMIYTTGSDTYATTSLTAAGRAILDDADASAQRTTLGLAIGTNVQAYDAGLQSISGLTTSANQMIYTTGSDTYATTSLTAAGRAILDDADAAAQRTTLGLGTLATQSGTFSGTSSGTNTGDQNIFQTIAVSGQSNVVADSTTDTLTFVAGSGVTITTNATTDSITIAATGSGGTVTSVDVSGGTTGLTTSGGPITGSGTITLAGTLAVANGGTGATDAGTARTNLGLAIGTDVQAYDAGLQSIAGLTTVADRMIYTTAADTYAVTTLTAAGRAILDDASASAQRTTLGLAIGTNVQAYDAGLQSISGLTTVADRMIYTTAADTYAVTTLTAAGRAILDDADATAQRATLGLVIGTDVQAYDADLAAIAGLAVTDGNFIVGNGTAWVAESGATARTSLGLGSIATQASNSVTITGGSITGITDLAVADGGTGASDAGTARTNLGLAIGTNVQAYDAGLQSISGLTTVADRMIYTTASDTYAVTTLTAAGRAILDDADASAQRTTLGLGTIATQAANNVSITGGSISGITDLAVADGGTGASSFTANNVLLGNGTSAFQVVAPGTSGNVLTSNGTTWTSATPSGGVDYQEFTSSGTWTKPSGVTVVYAEVISGGGSGGAYRADTGTRGAGGGGGGGLIRGLFLASSLGATESVTIGAGGAAAVRTTNGATNGNAGGSSTFSTLTVPGGGGGFATTSGGDSSGGAAGPFGGDGGLGSAGSSGSNGTYGGGGGGGTTTSVSGAGGTSLIAGAGGAAARSAVGTVTATSGTAPGGGGGGVGISTTTGTATSGAGAAGRVRIWSW